MDEKCLNQVEELFHEARQRAAAERGAFLDGACRGDLELRAEVESLLAHGPDAPGAGAVLESASELRERGPLQEGPGAVIGPYKLLQLVGEGGFGVVYMAEQREPVRRRVALKVIKLGMDTKQVIARFEAERQALALMDHPNVAKVLDAGATADRTSLLRDGTGASGDFRSPSTATRTRHATPEERLRSVHESCVERHTARTSEGDCPPGYQARPT